jgi:hypothetical protein
MEREWQRHCVGALADGPPPPLGIAVRPRSRWRVIKDVGQPPGSTNAAHHASHP